MHRIPRVSVFHLQLRTLEALNALTYEIMNLCYKTRKKCEDLAAENISTWNKYTKYGTISSVHALAAAMLAPEGILLAS